MPSPHDAMVSCRYTLTPCSRVCYESALARQVTTQLLPVASADSVNEMVEEVIQPALGNVWSHAVNTRVRKPHPPLSGQYPIRIKCSHAPPLTALLGLTCACSLPMLHDASCVSCCLTKILLHSSVALFLQSLPSHPIAKFSLRYR